MQDHDRRTIHLDSEKSSEDHPTFHVMESSVLRPPYQALSIAKPNKENDKGIEKTGRIETQESEAEAYCDNRVRDREERHPKHQIVLRKEKLKQGKETHLGCQHSPWFKDGTREAADLSLSREGFGKVERGSLLQHNIPQPSCGRMAGITSSKDSTSASTINVPPEVIHENSLSSFRFPPPYIMATGSSSKSRGSTEPAAPSSTVFSMAADGGERSMKVAERSLVDNNSINSAARRYSTQSRHNDIRVPMTKDERAISTVFVANKFGCYEDQIHEPKEHESSYHMVATGAIQAAHNDAGCDDFLDSCTEINHTRPKGKPSMRHASPEQRLTTNAQINTDLQTSTISVVQPDSLDNKGKVLLFSIPNRGQKSSKKDHESYNFHNELVTGMATKNMLLSKKEPFVTTQPKLVSSYVNHSDMTSFQKKHIRVATLGANIPVFLTACEVPGQDKTDVNAKHLSADSAFGLSQVDRIQGNSTRHGPFEDLGRRVMISQDGASTSWDSLKVPVSVDHLRVNSTTQTCNLDECARKVLVPRFKHRSGQGQAPTCFVSAGDIRPVTETLPNSNALPETKENAFSTETKTTGNAPLDSVLPQTLPLYQYSGKLNSFLPKESDDQIRKRVAAPLFNPLQTTAGEALVFLSPSTSFHKPTTTPTITHSRSMLPNLCGDGASPLLMPYATRLHEHSVNFTLKNTLLNQPESSVFQQQNLWGCGEFPLQESIKGPYTSVPQPPQASLSNKPMLHTLSLTTNNTSAAKACQIQPSTTLLLLNEQQAFATPAFDLLSSVAKSPAVSISKLCKAQAPIAHVSSSHGIANISPYLQMFPQTSDKSTDRIFQPNTSSDLHSSKVASGNKCFTSKDHGYDLLSSKKLKRYRGHVSNCVQSFRPIAPNLCSNADSDILFQATDALGGTKPNVDNCSIQADSTCLVVGASPGKSEYNHKWEEVKKWHNHQLFAQSRNTKSTKIYQSVGTLTSASTSTMEHHLFDDMYTSNGAMSSIVPHSKSLGATSSTANSTNASKSSSVSSSGNSTKPSRPDNMCPVCCRLFTRSWLLKGHMRTHTGERPYQCSHPTCHKAFADRSNLRSHMLTHTAAAKCFSCPRCSRTFSQKRYLHKHATEVCKVNADA